eukprot:2089373-Prorocentrum_lima.AAC.1
MTPAGYHQTCGVTYRRVGCGKPIGTSCSEVRHHSEDDFVINREQRNILNGVLPVPLALNVDDWADSPYDLPVVPKSGEEVPGGDRGYAAGSLDPPNLVMERAIDPPRETTMDYKHLVNANPPNVLPVLQRAEGYLPVQAPVEAELVVQETRQTTREVKKNMHRNRKT